jgi:ArsR family transcriptional regulator
MESLLTCLRACAEPTRLRLLALAARGSFCVMDFCDILDQSQPRLSRHLRLLTEAGLLERVREGANVWLTLPPATHPRGSLARAVLARLPEGDPVLAADRRQAARVLAERARAASESFLARGAEWDEMRALGLPAETVEQVLLGLLPAGAIDRLIDIGTGTGRLLELLAPRVNSAVGIDASRAMLALARARLSRPEAGGADLSHCAVRLGDMYRLPAPDATYDVAVMQMLLHHAEDPPAALAEAARVLRPGGRLLVVDLARHADAQMLPRLAHRWPGFDDAAMRDWLRGAGLIVGAADVVAGPPDVRLWAADRPCGRPLADKPAERTMEVVI